MPRTKRPRTGALHKLRPPERLVDLAKGRGVRRPRAAFGRAASLQNGIRFQRPYFVSAEVWVEAEGL